MYMDGKTTRRGFVASLGGTALGLATASRAWAQAAEEEDEMVLVPAGTAIVGTSTEEVQTLAERYDIHASWLAIESPRREVELAAFYIDRLPVTGARYAEFCTATDRRWPFARQVAADPDGAGRLPVAFVNAVDAAAYAEWAGGRLPTEEEWEYAARGPDGLAYPWGNEWDPARCNCNHDKRPGGRGPTPVDAYPEGASPFGVLDMVGNLCEWTATGHKHSRVVKGGFFKQHEPYRFRVACKLMTQLTNNRQDYIGFRCARDA